MGCCSSSESKNDNTVGGVSGKTNMTAATSDSTKNPEAPHQSNSMSNENGKQNGKEQTTEYDSNKPGTASEFKARYQLKQILGNGNYSVVREAIDKTTEEHVAVKCIDKKKLTKEDEEALKVETGILGELNHPNIIKLYGFYDEPSNYYIVTEFMQGGELFDRIVKKEYYSEVDAQKVVRTLADAIKYCHDRGIVHRDLKPENILMKDQKDDAAIKIADFGFARKEKGGLHTPCGTPGYVAPEIIKNQTYGKAVDMWSLGVIIYILLCGYPPFYNQNQTLLFNQIRSGHFEFDSPYWDPVSDSAKDLIRGLLTVDPTRRLTIDQLLAHPWVGSSAADKDLTPALAELKKFNARRKIRAGAKAALAAAAFSKMSKKSEDASGGGEPNAEEKTSEGEMAIAKDYVENSIEPSN